MNKTAIKNFAVWARNKLIADVRYRAGLVGITGTGIQKALPQSNYATEFYDIGTASPYTVSGLSVRQRRNLAEAIRQRAADSDYSTAYQYIMEEVAYTWFNRLTAIRFMEVNGYLPVRVLSSESGKIEPDLVTNPFDAGLDLTAGEEQTIFQLKLDNQLDELFRLLFIKQCNALYGLLPALFEPAEDYTELLLNLSAADQDGVVWRLTHDIPEEDFNVEKGGQVEIIGWLYQYYNTEPKAKVFGRPSGQRIKKEELPAVTQLFTPDWIVRYMVENSLGRLWLEGHPDGALRAKWEYYLDEAEQTPEAQARLEELRAEYRYLNPEDIKFIDPCMGSGHILVYAFDVLMQIYERAGWARREAVRSILEKNLYGLDIDKRACQMAYFAVMMKAQQYDRRVLTRKIAPHVYEVQASGWTEGKYPADMGNFLLSKEHQETLNYLLETFRDAKEYGSLLRLEQRDYAGLLEAWQNHAEATAENVNMVLWYGAVEQLVPVLIQQAIVLTQTYDVAVTNPPYMAVSGASGKMQAYIKKNYPDSKTDLFAVFMERCGQMTGAGRFQAMITQHAWMFLSSYEKLRAKLRIVDTVNMAHLGPRAFEEIGGEVVQTTSFVLRKSHTPGYQGTYCRLIEPSTQQGKEELFLSGTNRYTARQDDFSKIPGAPTAYWLSAKAFSIFDRSVSFDSFATTRAGMITGNNSIFIRLWYEVGWDKIGIGLRSRTDAVESGRKWFPYNKGGEFRKWYGNNEYVVNWENDGAFMRNFKDSSGKIPAHAFNLDYIFKENVTWNSLSSYKYAARYTDFGFLYDASGSFADVNNRHIGYVLAFLCSCVAQLYLEALNPTLNFQKGNIAALPFLIDANPLLREKIDRLVQDNIRISRADWDAFETSWDFTRHPLARSVPTIAQAYAAWEAECAARFARLKANEEELNRIFTSIYGLQDELTPEVEDKDVTVRPARLQRDIRSLLSYAVGCMFGRYSIYRDGLVFAGGEWNEDAFAYDPSQRCDDGWFLPDADNILPLTDEAYLEDDIITRLCQWLRAVYGPDTLEENLDFIAKALGNKGATAREVIRNYFLKDFFADHCKIYQKRPIYWLFDSGRQNGFKALVYLHRYTPDTIGRLRVDYLHRLQRVYASEIERMQDMADNSKNQREVIASSKRKEKLQKQLKECQEYDGKIAHLALARIGLDLDDGVKVNYEKIQTAADGKKYPVLGPI